MKKFTLSTLAAIIGLAISASAMAEPLTQAQYKAAKTEISKTYTSEKAACKSLAANAKDICIVEAKGHEKISKAENEAAYKPSVKNTLDVRMAKADAAYAVAKEKCDDAADNAKDVCRKEAKSAFVAAKADAEVAEKTSAANATASTKKTDARKDAATEKRDAAYAVAKEKCDALAGDAKTSCIADAKKLYGQN